MMFFRKKQQRELEVTNEVYARWLRAQRPDWFWFLGLSELEQEQLAIIGEENMRDIVVAIGFAMQDPQLAQASLAAESGDAAGEEALALRLVQNLAQRIYADEATKPRTTQPATMAGIGERKGKARRIEKPTRVLFGQEASTEQPEPE